MTLPPATENSLSRIDETGRGAPTKKTREVMMNKIIEPIGYIRSCFDEKFGIPRQPGLIDSARGIIELTGAYNRAECVRGLDSFSHIWLSFLFHGCPEGQWSPTVRPPRLGGNERVGVFATRSTFRPNGMGLSVVRVESIESKANVRIHVSGVDLMDKTPIVDIKPYLPWADSLPDAASGFAQTEPSRKLTVTFTPVAERTLTDLRPNDSDLRTLIQRVIELDPRPAYQQKASSERSFGISLKGLNIRWLITENTAEVFEITKGPKTYT